MSTSSRLIAIVPAAGVGARALPSDARDKLCDAAAVQNAGQPSSVVPKQYRLVAGQPMLRLAVLALLRDTRIERVIVAVSPGDAWVAAALADLPRVTWLECGGTTRSATVSNALARCGACAEDWVLVHDAARPGLPETVLAALIDACLEDEVGGLVAMPVADTIKAQTSPPQSESGGTPSPAQTRAVARVAHTVPREGLWQAQTPQMFRAGLLRRALAHADVRAIALTDEASAVEALGLAPCLVAGSLRNFKLTWPQDFDLMEKLLHD